MNKNNRQRTFSIVNIKLEKIESNIAGVTGNIDHFRIEASQMEGELYESSQSYLLCELRREKSTME